MRNGAAAALASSTKSFQPSGLSCDFQVTRLHLFVIDEAGKTAHAVTFDEGDHVIFKVAEIVGGRRHKGLWIDSLYARMRGRGQMAGVRLRAVRR